MLLDDIGKYIEDNSKQATVLTLIDIAVNDAISLDAGETKEITAGYAPADAVVTWDTIDCEAYAADDGTGDDLSKDITVVQAVKAGSTVTLDVTNNSTGKAYVTLLGVNGMETTRPIGTNVFLGILPASAPDACILLTEYQGAGSIRTSGGVAIEQPRLQILIRDTDYQEARKTSEEIYRLLDGQMNETINGVRYQKIEAQAPPSILDRLGNVDQGERYRIVTNFAIMKELG
jgi:hypothetical protein